MDTEISEAFTNIVRPLHTSDSMIRFAFSMERKGRDSSAHAKVPFFRNTGSHYHGTSAIPLHGRPLRQLPED
jgi:hypothetical protein